MSYCLMMVPVTNGARLLNACVRAGDWDIEGRALYRSPWCKLPNSVPSWFLPICTAAPFPGVDLVGYFLLGYYGYTLHADDLI